MAIYNGKRYIRLGEGCCGKARYLLLDPNKTSELHANDHGKVAIKDCDGNRHDTLEGVQSFRASSFVANSGYALDYIYRLNCSGEQEIIWSRETGKLSDCIEVPIGAYSLYEGVFKRVHSNIQENGDWCMCGFKFAKGNLTYDTNNDTLFIADPFFSAYHEEGPGPQDSPSSDGYEDQFKLVGGHLSSRIYQGNNQSTFTLDDGTDTEFHIPTAAEWNCIMNCRKTGITMDGVENCRFAHVIIDDMEENNKKYYGFIVFPDDFTLPASVPEFMGCNAYVSGYVDNNITIDQWNDLDEAGCVFLSADSNGRAWKSMFPNTKQIHYWTCTDSPDNPNNAYHQCGNSNQEGLDPQYAKGSYYTIRPIVYIDCDPSEIDEECRNWNPEKDETPKDNEN